MDKIIDGKKLAAEREEDLRKQIVKLSKKLHIVSILVGDDQASQLYSNLKQKKASELEINFELIKFSVGSSYDEVVKKIEQLNQDESIHGIMVQLPLPIEFLGSHQAQELLDKIDPKKDVDGLTGRGPVPPATVRGVLSILDSLKINYQDKILAVVGSKGAIGKEMVKALIKKDAEIVEVDKKRPSTSLEDIKEANVVISCTGDRNSIAALHIGSGTVLIDVGLGDFDPSCFEKAVAYTPERGGVGPMTVISLMENVVEIFERKN